ncbi:MAG TPA: hypothetical protein VFD49_21510 [Candidatus Dormibacteraeota bacterium]|nr:hypothetical protein [Candidatus Dormibacteraeota bacterium]
MAVALAGRIEVEQSPSGPREDDHSHLRGPYVGIASFDGRQWSSLCPELDIASVGSTAEEAIDNLVQAVIEAVRFAEDEGIDPGQPVPPAELRRFLVSSQAPYFVRQFYVS